MFVDTSLNKSILDLYLKINMFQVFYCCSEVGGRQTTFVQYIIGFEVNNIFADQTPHL